MESAGQGGAAQRPAAPRASGVRGGAHSKFIEESASRRSKNALHARAGTAALSNPYSAGRRSPRMKRPATPKPSAPTVAPPHASRGSHQPSVRPPIAGAKNRMKNVISDHVPNRLLRTPG